VLTFDIGDRLRAAANRLADAALARDYAQRPVLLDRYGEKGRAKYRQDLLYNIQTLASAVDADDPSIFLRYVEWLKVLLVNRGVADEDIAESLRCLAAAIFEVQPSGPAVALAYLHASLEQFDSMPDTVPSFVDGSSEELKLARRCLEALRGLDSASVRVMLEKAISEGMPLARIYTGIVPPLMREVGRLWQLNEISVAHEHYCRAAVQSILGRFYGVLFSAGKKSGRSMLVACVAGEQHELGARTLADLFELSGWRTSFLGADVPSRELVALIKQSRRPPDLIALSATMPENLGSLASTMAAVRDGLRVPIMVGGTLFHGRSDLATRLGADASADDAEAALARADELVSLAA
jgi:MerR family transcriptional regulator, light-induced transcriptional regulator